MVAAIIVAPALAATENSSQKWLQRLSIKRCKLSKTECAAQCMRPCHGACSPYRSVQPAPGRVAWRSQAMRAARSASSLTPA